ncbi:MAG: NTP transferase domain-containing protein [Patescibacteria group bacterium]
MTTQIIILAAGKGKRMGSDLPKALVLLNGRPMIDYLAQAVVKSQVCEKPIVVVAPDNGKLIREELKEYGFTYAVQDEQLGSGHAVSCALGLLSPNIDRIIVLYCDHPFFSAGLIKNLSTIKTDSLILVPTILSDFENWHRSFFHWGRVLRINGKLEKIVEFRDASPQEIEVKELNSGVMAFDTKWLIKNIRLLNNSNNQGEYYLTSLVEIAFHEKRKIPSIIVEPREALGINSPEELFLAENIINKNL